MIGVYGENLLKFEVEQRGENCKYCATDRGARQKRQEYVAA